MRHFSRRDIPVFFFLICLAALTAVWECYCIQCDALAGGNIVSKTFNALADMAVLLLPYWLLPRRQRWLVLVPLYLVPVWCVCGLCYYRFWHDIPGLSSLFLASNLNTELLRSAYGLFKATDLLLFLPSLLTTYLFIIWRRQGYMSQPLDRKVKALAIAATVVVFIASQFLHTRTALKNNPSHTTYMEATLTRLDDSVFSNCIDLAKNGAIIHFFKSAYATYSILNTGKELTASEKEEIRDFIEESRTHNAPDARFATNVRKNLIVIVVESLNSYAVTAKIAGREVAPVMNGLLHQPGTISALDIVTQIRTGGSGDGQLLINTGLHPLPDFSTAIAVGSKVTFPSLASAFPSHDSMAIFGDDASTWNEHDTFRSFGFGKIHTNSEYSRLLESHGTDAALLEFGFSKIKTLRQPFFVELLTASMHVPFNDTNIPSEELQEWIKGSGLNDTNRDYLRMVNYFDTALGEFIGNLRKAGLYDDTVLVIVSDHSQEFSLGDTGLDQTDVRMAFIAANTGVTESISRTGGQIDVFPTILQIMHACASGGWTGAGTSLLNPDLSSAFIPQKGFIGISGDPLKERQEKAYAISENILRGDYFKK